jgi:hypothetical protein
MHPNQASVIESLDEFRMTGENAFLGKYAGGARPKTYYLVHEGKHYPLKAIWAAAHRPTTLTRTFTTERARRGFAQLGFDKFWPEKISD